MSPRRSSTTPVLNYSKPDQQPPAAGTDDAAPLPSSRAASVARHMSLKQLAAFLNRDRNTVQKYIDQGMPVIERADRDRGVSWVIDSAEAVRFLEERAVAKVTDRLGDVRGMTEQEAKDQHAVYKMVSAGVAAAEDVRMVAKISSMLDLIRRDYTELRLRLTSIPDTLAGKVDAKISVRIRDAAEEQIRMALDALVADAEVEALSKG